MSQCNRCQQEIRWTVTTNGKKMPCDPEPSPNGTFYLIKQGRDTIALHRKSTGHELMLQTTLDDPMYTSHFDTCGKTAITLIPDGDIPF